MLRVTSAPAATMMSRTAPLCDLHDCTCYCCQVGATCHNSALAHTSATAKLVQLVFNVRHGPTVISFKNMPIVLYVRKCAHHATRHTLVFIPPAITCARHFRKTLYVANQTNRNGRRHGHFGRRGNEMVRAYKTNGMFLIR